MPLPKLMVRGLDGKRHYRVKYQRGGATVLSRWYPMPVKRHKSSNKVVIKSTFTADGNYESTTIMYKTEAGIL